MSEQTAGVQALTLHTITEDNWQTDLRDSIRSASALLNAVNLSADDLGEHERAALEFPIRVPLPFVARMIPGDPHDPLLRQVITDRAETLPAPGFIEDRQAMAMANYHITDRWTSSIGYRNLSVDYKDGDFMFDTANEGVQVALLYQL
jgi:L-lysine 2,3-aminomutase